MVFSSDDAKRLKQEFPLFQQVENRRLIYLDNAATTQKPSSVIEGVTHFYRHCNANAHRSSHRLARAATAQLETARERAALFLNAVSADEVIFCRGATEALNLLAFSFTEGFHPGDEIILSKAEHHANIVPWQMAAKRRGLTLKYLPSERGGYVSQQESALSDRAVTGRPDLTALKTLITTKTRLISLTAASNVLGFKVDLQAVRDFIAQLPEQKRESVCFVVDASQLAAHEAIDVQAIGCDFLVCSAHKFYGPTGVGLLYGKRSRLRALPPWQGGGEMITQVGLISSEYAEGVHRFEAGTSSLAAIAGLGRCFEFLQRLDREAIANYEAYLVKELHRILQTKPYIKLLSQPYNNVGIVTLVPTLQYNIQDIAYWLDEQEIAVRIGRHCAEPLMDELGVSATLRASVGTYTTEEDIHRFIDAMDECVSEINQVKGQVAFSTDSSSSDQKPTKLPCYPEDDLQGLELAQLAAIKDWQTRYRTVLKWGALIKRKALLRQSNHTLKGCEAEAWLDYQVVNGRYRFYIDSDSRVVKGLAAIVLLLVNNKTKRQIEQLDLAQQFQALNLEKHLSQSRSNGFQVMVRRIEAILLFDHG